MRTSSLPRATRRDDENNSLHNPVSIYRALRDRGTGSRLRRQLAGFACRTAFFRQEADAGLQQTGKEKELADLLGAVHRKLGNAEADSLFSIRAQVWNGASSLVTIYKTRFDRGTGTETFTWKQHGDQLKLLGYYIQSNALVIN